MTLDRTEPVPTYLELDSMVSPCGPRFNQCPQYVPLLVRKVKTPQRKMNPLWGLLKLGFLPRDSQRLATGDDEHGHGHEHEH